MKKTSKSPENVEVTPNKKKLKQARLPFMPLSDVSPKAETPPSRKRKLSVPDAPPVTKVSKVSNENGETDELLVISDDESRSVDSPKNPEKLPNPYVKIVDAARKKKLRKSKGSKKAKSKAGKKQIAEESENQTQQDSIDNNDCEDVEMVEVEALIHHDNVTLNSEVKTPIAENTTDKESNNNSKTKNVSPQKQPQILKVTSTKDSPKNKTSKATKINKKETKLAPVINETICLNDSNNSSDVTLPKETSDKLDSLEKNKELESADQIESIEQSIEVPSNEKNDLTEKEKKLTPKRSTRIQTKHEENSKKNIESYLQNQQPDKVKSKSPKKTDSKNMEDPQKEDSDVELIEESCTVSKDTEEEKTPQSAETTSKTDLPMTPKRSSRNKTIDKSTSSILDESMSSNPSTPRQTDKSLNESMKNLTPKQMAKRLEAVKRKEEREKEKLDREKKRQQEKEERAKQRQEKEDQKKREREEKEEIKRKEREEKEEQRKKEKEEKEKQKELERKAREEKEEAKKKEREEKEEQKRKEKEAKEEERRKKQEALELEKQEQELKLKKTKEAFVSFFVPKQKVDKEPSPSEKDPVSKSSMLSTFTIKVDMRLAPTCRAELSSDRREALDKLIQEQDPEINYLKSLKDGTSKPGCCGKTWPLSEKDDDIMIVEDELPPLEDGGEVVTCESAPRETLRPKLLSFHENRRPPYWGTWRKKSDAVTPRRPFGQEKILDYEVDSDEDWEDEGDGESLDGSAGGSDDDGGGDDYEVDHEVFVPHGYLSDEEATMDEEDDVLSLSPETQKARLKKLEDEFESEMKKPTEKLKPRIYGLLWENSEGGKPDNCVDALWNYFQKYAMIVDDLTPFLQPPQEPEKEQDKKKRKKKLAEEGKEQSPKSKKKKEAKTENKEKKPKQEAKKTLPNQPGINSFLKKVNNT